MDIGLILSVGAIFSPSPSPAPDSPGVVKLAAARQILAAGKPISVEIGHAAPAWADIDGDGKEELLVGQFGDGKLRVYPNDGTRENPSFGSYSYLQAGGADASVPSG